MKKEQAKKKKVRDEIGNPYGDYVLSDDDEDINVTSPPSIRSERAKGKESLDSNESKKRKVLQNYFAPRTTSGAQPSIKSALQSKEAI